jgi:hypothetical protein
LWGERHGAGPGSGDYVPFPDGLELPKVPDFQGEEFAFSYMDELIYYGGFGRFCLNDQGQVVSYRQ